jgi:hypothetical protein
MLRAAEFQNRGFPQLGASATQRGHLHRYANGCGTREEARELPGAIDFVFDNRNFGGTLHAASRPADATAHCCGAAHTYRQETQCSGDEECTSDTKN